MKENFMQEKNLAMKLEYSLTNTPEFGYLICKKIFQPLFDFFITFLFINNYSVYAIRPNSKMNE